METTHSGAMGLLQPRVRLILLHHRLPRFDRLPKRSRHQAADNNVRFTSSLCKTRRHQTPFPKTGYIIGTAIVTASLPLILPRTSEQLERARLPRPG